MTTQQVARCYEVVVSRPNGMPCEYISCDSLHDAKSVLWNRQRGSDQSWNCIFIRQYIRDRLGRPRFRVLHRFTVKEAA